MSPMLNLANYQAHRQIYAGPCALVYQAIRIPDQRPVIIKVLRNPYPNFRELVQFRNQYVLTRNLDHSAIVRPLALENYGNGYALVMPDQGAIALSDYWPQGDRSLGEFLVLAIQLAQALHYLNQHRIIHKDLKPDNILIHPTTGNIQLIDFSIASLLPQEQQQLTNPNHLEGTLAYMSPEQTGRMNRGIDYRTDFYSLGVTLYELWTGRLPFGEDDPMQLLHCHLSQAPTPPHLLTQVHNPNDKLRWKRGSAALPPQFLEVSNTEASNTHGEILSQIILKLMAKNGEDRYQSALGLKHDLERCLYQWQRQGMITPFPLAEQDICDRFLIPEKLYGRDQEVERLLAAFNRVALGKGEGKGEGEGENQRESNGEMVLVAGTSGVGKTAVINEIHKPITRQQGYFIKGKFDQFNRNIPFSAVVQAFQNLMGQLLAEPDAQLAQWKRLILQAVGENGQVLIEIIPELERVIGPQPPVLELAGTAAQNRFNLLLERLITVFTHSRQPLVLFLDDLQWADSASLQLIKLLMERPGRLLLLGAYRDNEVSVVHPLMWMVKDLKKSGKAIATLTLQPLAFMDLNQLIADTLACAPNQAETLSTLIHRKTQGNPFFSTQFLKSLQADQYISFDYDRGHWQCDLDQINALSLTDNVVELMAQKLQKLSPQTQNLLKLAACIGNQFDLAALGMVAEDSAIAVAQALWEALQSGLILIKGEAYKFYLDQDYFRDYETVADRSRLARLELDLELDFELDNGIGQTVEYRFLHDRIQQAAYSLIPKPQKRQVHYQIGQLLAQKIPLEKQHDRIFAIVNQLNYGLDLITSQPEREHLAQLNLLACQKARGTAYGAVQQYATIGLQLLGDQAWQRHYGLTLRLHELGAEAVATLGNFEELPPWIEAVIHQAPSLLDQLEVYLIQIQALTRQNQFREAIAWGQSFLAQLGVDFPDPVTPEVLHQAIGEVRDLIGNRTLEDLLALPDMVEPEKLAIMKIAGRIIPACYLANSPLFPLLACLQVRVSVQYGNNPIASTGYADYAMFILHFQKDMATSHHTSQQLGQLAYQLAATAQDQNIPAVTFVPVGLFLHHHHHHLRETIGIFQRGYEAALAVGKWEYVGHHSQGFCLNAYGCGQPLGELATQIQAYGQMMAQLKLTLSQQYCSIFWELSQSLLGNPDGIALEIEGDGPEPDWVAASLESRDITRLFYFFVHRGQLRFWQGKLSLAKQDMDRAREYRAGGMATVAEAGLYFYDSLITLAMLSSSDQAPGDESLGDALLGDALLGDALLGDALLGDASQGDKSQGQAIEPKPGLQTVEVNQEQLQAWAKSAPMNYLHKWQLVAAEKCRVLGDRLGAIDYYDQAIVGAKTHGYLQEEALANELAARFYLDWSKEKAALGYLQDAYYGYARWGAKIKTDQLENAYPQLLAPILQKITLEPDSPLTNSPNPGSNSSSSSLTGTNVMGTSGRRNSMPTLRTVTTPTAFLDLATVLKASQALSQEIKLDTLFSKLMQIAGENAGADRGVLILQRPEGWEVVAQWSNDTCDLGVMALDQVNTIPHTIINTVRRSQQAILLKDLAQDNTFVADPYFLHQAPHQAPQSLLCCPILNQGKLLGLLYLENTLSKGAFTADRLEILTLLMAQVAISLENAQLYHRLANYSHDLETQVEQRTQELQANNAKLQETLQQLKRRQAQLIQAEKMSSLGQMVAGVAHEINNPINFIGTNVAHARRYCQDLLELVHLYQWESPQPSSTIQAKIEDMDLPFLADDLTKLLDSMERGSDRIHQIILGLRNFSRLDEAERKSVDIHEGIDSTLLMLHHRLHSEGIEVIKDYGSLPLVQCYGSQLNQVFFNIFANAIDVLSPDLSPDVSPDVSSPERLSQLSPNLRTKPDFNSQIHITTEQRNGQADGQIVVITIADNGPGMTAETRQRIFDPFFTTKPVGKGTGLGLSICYQVITELHRGQLHCQSQPGKGTSFIIEIPKDEAK